MHFKSLKHYLDVENTLQINQEFSITYDNGTTSYFIIMPYGADYHNLNGSAYTSNRGTKEYMIYGDHLGTNLTNEEFEKLKNYYFKKLTFQ